MKCIFIGYGVGMKGYKLWDSMVRKILCIKKVIFREVKSYPSMMQLEEHEKKLMVHIPPKTKKMNQKMNNKFMVDLMRRMV
jgi:hypothetical protein